MFNRATFLGHIAKDGDIRYSQNGLAVYNTAIGVNKVTKDQNGQRQEKVMFMDIVFFGKQAEVAKQYLCKGSKVLVEGEIEFQRWVDQGGQNRSKHILQVQYMEMLSDGQNQNNNNRPQNNGYQNFGFNNSVPQNNYQKPDPQIQYEESQEENIPF